MSLHASLKAPRAGKSHRNVLKKYERILKLQEQKRWDDGDSVYNLPKVRSIKLRKKKTAKTADATDTETTQEAGADSKESAKS